MLRIARDENGWYTYTLRKVRAVRPFALVDLNALSQSWTRLLRVAGKAWRHVRIVLGHRRNKDEAQRPERSGTLEKT